MCLNAQVGDLVRTIKSDDGYFDEGEIFEVINVNFHGVHATNTKNKTLHLGNNEYVIHRKAGEEDSETVDFPEEGEGLPYTRLLDAEPAQDVVNSPSHYTQGRTEVIDIIKDAVQGADPFEAVCQANILKYTLRYRHKNGVEDLKKAVWYTEKLIAYLDAKST